MVEVVYNFLLVLHGSKQITMKRLSIEHSEELTVIFAILSIKQDDTKISKIEDLRHRQIKKNLEKEFTCIALIMIKKSKPQYTILNFKGM